jgi:hypothetical protein
MGPVLPTFEFVTGPYVLARWAADRAKAQEAR